MAGDCPAIAPDAPIVRALLGVVDCNVQTLVHDGYATLFAPSAGFSGVLTLLLTIWVALIGYQLLWGRTQIRVTDFALNAVKLGAVLALATQWSGYEAVVYRFLFDGPQQLATAMLGGVQPAHSQFRGDVFDGLQRAFGDMSSFANGYAAHTPPGASPLLGGAGFGALIMTSSASILLLSTLGVLLAAKIVLGLLLALGPVFIVLFLFDSTRGLFEGWARAAVAFAFAPLASIFLLGLMLTILEPTLLQIEALQKRGIFTLEPAYNVIVLVLVFAGVTLGALIAGGMIAGGFKLKARGVATPAEPDRSGAPVSAAEREPAPTSRAVRSAAAAAAMERRDSLILERSGSPAGDRRTTVVGAPTQRGARDAVTSARLGQGFRRAIQPRSTRSSGGRDGLRGAS